MGKGKPFEPGNTAGKGRPLGSLNRKTIFQQELEKDGAAIIQKIKQRALKADPMAMRLCMERLVPLAKEPNTRFRLPAVETAANLTEAFSAVAEAVAEGELSAQEGELMARIVESQRRNIEVGEFEARIRALETTPAETGRGHE
jgi:hypothetical protein